MKSIENIANMDCQIRIVVNRALLLYNISLLDLQKLTLWTPDPKYTINRLSLCRPCFEVMLRSSAHAKPLTMQNVVQIGRITLQ